MAKMQVKTDYACLYIAKLCVQMYTVYVYILFAVCISK